MGCFTGLKIKKKKSNKVSKEHANVKEKSLAALPEPVIHGRSLQSAPPSFKTRSKADQPCNRTGISRARVLSAPSSLAVADEDRLWSIELEEQEENKNSGPFMKEQRVSNPQPLPLPEPQDSSILKNMGSFKASTSNSSSLTSGPLPLPPFRGLRSFSFKDIAAACQDFSSDKCVSEGLSSVVYAASFGDDASSSKRREASVTRILSSTQGFKEFVSEVLLISSLQHPLLCKLLGFHAREGSNQRMLVYERLYHGSLDRLLYGRSDGPSIDWATRMKVALCAAKGLLFLHEEGPFQAMYNEFSTANIQIDKDFSAKLSGYGCVSYNSEAEILNSSAVASISVETLEKGLLTPKSNVWSFGVVLLELLTGRKHLDPRHTKEDRNLVKWSRPYLTDSCRLPLIMDPRLKGRFPLKAARTIADLALRCLQKDPSERPTMRAIVDTLEDVQEMKYSCRFRLQEPTAAPVKLMQRSPSLNGIVVPMPRSSFSLSPPRPTVTEPHPLQKCSSTLSFQDSQAIPVRRTPLLLPLRRAGVEGF
ncbi:unnamed protein product [Spirodela intermedia]|uniref:Protein kinase domain-containing protein n=1 Tax=Spirodela intermedia TaxID=51605 RepID=A0A7I8L979_SPIIN|nr:unnamed protein product [Spirodela intermedia]